MVIDMRDVLSPNLNSFGWMHRKSASMTLTGIHLIEIELLSENIPPVRLPAKWGN